MSLDVAIRVSRPGFAVDAAFSVPNGVTSLFGPSGAGKTTVIEVLAGLLRPDQGRVTLDNVVLTDTARGIAIPPHRRGVAVVFQDARLFPHLSVRGNLRYGAWFAANDSQDFERIVTMLGIEALLGRRPGTLSGGERARVAIGRALLTKPRLLILDEPLASIDQSRAEEILPYIERLRDEAGLPIIHVSHSLGEVVRLADTLVLLDRGRVTGVGPTTEILGRLEGGIPGGERGAIINAEVKALDPENYLATLSFDGGQLIVPDHGLALGQRLRLRIAAGDIALATTRPEGISILNILDGRIEAVVPGTAGTVEIAVAVGATRLIARVTSLSAESLRLVPGGQVYALIKSIALDRGRRIGSGA